jgi:hypothetical protein
LSLLQLVFRQPCCGNICILFGEVKGATLQKDYLFLYSCITLKRLPRGRQM